MLTKTEFMLFCTNAETNWIFWKNCQFSVIIKPWIVVPFLTCFYLVRSIVVIVVKIIVKSIVTRNCYQKIFKKSSFQGNIKNILNNDKNIVNNVHLFSWLLFKSSHSTIKVFLKKSENSQENKCGKIFLFKRLLQAFIWTLFKKRLNTGVLLWILLYYLYSWILCIRKLPMKQRHIHNPVNHLR